MISYPIATNGVRSRVLEAGRGSGEIWLLHGVGGRADRWAACLELFASEGFLARALDLPGHGFASRSRRFPYSVSAFTEFVTATIAEQANAEQVTIVGTSFGSMLAAGAASRMSRPPTAPQVNALVLCASMGVIPLGDPVRNAIAERLGQTDRDEVQSRLAFMNSLPADSLDTLVEEEFRISTSPGTVNAYTRIAATIRTQVDSEPLMSDLQHLAPKLPMLQIWGSEDQSIPIDVGRRIAQLLPTMETVEIDGAGHAPYLQQPTEFCRHIVDFLRRVL